MSEARAEQAARLMGAFAVSTGLSGAQPRRRYLWTDAHAVCNFLALETLTGDPDFRGLALRLVDQVHEVLGRHRDDGPDTGWLSGLDDGEARRHPTIGGLRIGKPLPERRPDEPYDESREWDRDGQYYHYLTKWMHALRQVAAATGERRYLTWAQELAHTAYHRFRVASGQPRLYWKMSTDLSRPLLAASGQHDPVDGLVTALTLRDPAGDDSKLGPVIAGVATMCRSAHLATGDPLGIGGVLLDAGRLAQLREPTADVDVTDLATRLLEAAGSGLDAYRNTSAWRGPAVDRLAFRELGLCIGIEALRSLDQGNPYARGRGFVQMLSAHSALATHLVQFWSRPEHQHTPTWTAHQDINRVMLATSLVPSGFVALGDLAERRNW